jgi:AcrR family transcriptional regulator
VPPKTVSEDEVLESLTALFRRSGYDGASLADIADATGLQKSSLYHRFPAGKEQMALVVVAQIAARFAGEVLAPLRDGDLALDERVRATGRRLIRFYDHGRASCLLDVLSVAATPAVIEALRANANAWVDALAAVARLAGCRPADARRRAADAVASVEGGLVVARVTGDRGAFLRAVERLPTVLGVEET